MCEKNKNKHLIDFLSDAKHEVLVPYLFTKSDADQYLSELEMSPLTDDQWSSVVRSMGKRLQAESEWNVFEDFFFYVTNFKENKNA
tara:strand:- start:675 stop:932 length:258 start_codon:yes stop_codon:yes gene_type:complete